MTDMKQVPQDMRALILEVATVVFKILYSIILSIVYLISPKQQKSVKGEIVLITGGGHGIGRELALLYASEGAIVVIWDINEKMGTETVEEISGRGYSQAHFFYCDVSNRDNVQSVAKQVQEKVGNVTILVNNAGVLAAHSLLDHTPLEVQRTINVNILAHFWTLEAFFPNMKKHNHGHIVAISSLAGLFGVPNLVSYGCSKFAIRGLMDALYVECRQNKNNGIKFTTIYPFFVNTGLCTTWRSKFKNLTPIVQTEDAAREIVKAQRLDLKEVSIPRHLLYLSSFFQLLPKQAQNHLMDFVSITVNSDV